MLELSLIESKSGVDALSTHVVVTIGLSIVMNLIFFTMYNNGIFVYFAKSVIILYRVFI